jgi:hypothetical protein
MVRSSQPGLSKAGSPLRLLALISGAFVTILGFLAGPLALSATATTPTGGNYTAVTPYRLDDTRAGSGFADAGKTLGAGGTITVQVANTGGPGGIPTTANTAVLNVTALNTTAPSFITAYPTGDTLPSGGIPTWSNLNFVAGQTVSNLVTVPLSSSGQVTLYNYQGSADLLVDAEGYYSSYAAASGSGLYDGVAPSRVFGTVAVGAPIGQNTTQNIAVTGADGVPANATAVVAQLTVAGGTAASFLTAFPAGVSLPGTSNLSFSAGETESTRAIVGVGTGGNISLYNYQGTVNVDVDISGYYTGAAGLGAVLVDISPQRLADTRTSFNGSPIGPGATEEFDLSSTGVIPINATGIAGNFTVIPGTGPGYITISSSSLSANPGTSDVNWPSNSGPVANYTSTDPPFNSDVNVYNYTAGGTVNLAIDAFAYFLPAGASPTPTPTPSANNATVTIIPTDGYTVPADAHTFDMLTTTVYGAGTAPVKLDPIKYTLVPSVGGSLGGPDSVANLSALSSSCGTLTSAPVVESPVPDTTPAAGNWWFGDTGGAPVNGQIQPTYTPSTVPGTCTITATEADFNQSATIVLTQTPTTFSVAVAANPTDVVANGGGAGGDTTVTATVTNIIGGPAVGDSVIFTSVPHPAGACGAMPASPVIAGADGTAVFTYTSTMKPGFCVITATEGFDGSQASTTIVQTKPASLATQVSISPAATTLPADGVSHMNFSNGVIYTGSSSPVLGDPLMTVESPPGCGLSVVPPVLFPGNEPSNPTWGVTSFGPVPDPGTNTEVFTAGTTPGPCTITTTEAFNGNQTSVVVNLTPKQNFIVLSATPNALTGNGVSVSEVSATVYGPTGAVVSSDLVTLEIISPQGDSCGTFPTGSTWHGLSDAAGVVEVPFTTSDILPTTSGSWCIIVGTEATTGGGGAPITIDQEYV